MQEEVRVRQAGPGDLPALAALRQAVGWSSGGLEGSFAAAAAGRQVILLAEVRGTILGAVTAAYASPGQGSLGHISDLLVAPLWRRRGLGGQLLAAAEAALAERGLLGVTLDVDAANAPALRLYAAHGYRHHRPAHFPWGPGHTLLKTFAPAPGRLRPSARPPTFLARLLGRQ